MAAILVQTSIPMFWVLDHDPGATEVLQSGVISQWDFVFNSVTRSVWILIDSTPGAFKWIKLNSILAQGTATLVAGSVVVPLAVLGAQMRISLSCLTPGGTPGAVFVSSKTAGTGFTIGSTSLLDSSIIAWQLHF